MSTRPALPYRRLAVATVVLVYLLIIMGGIVRVTGSGLGCADSWPSCNGSLLPAATAQSIIEFLHRSISLLAGIAVVALTLSTLFWERNRCRLLVAAIAAAVLYVLQAALGALVVKYELPGGVVMIHLANALLLLGVLVYVAVESGRRSTGPVGAGTADLLDTPRRDAHSADLRRPTVMPQQLPQRGASAATPAAPRFITSSLAALAAVATYILALSGAFVVENGAGAACNGWPLCEGGFALPSGEFAVINVAQRVVAGVGVVLLGVVMGIVIRRSRGDRAVRGVAMLVSALLVVQIAAGALVVLLGLPAWVRALHLSLASAIWASTVAVAVLTRRSDEVRAPAVDSQRTEVLRSPAGVVSA
ncbi:MAG: heme A synthase [Candidatus Dormibacteria bacterium]